MNGTNTNVTACDATRFNDPTASGWTTRRAVMGGIDTGPIPFSLLVAHPDGRRARVDLTVDGETARLLRVSVDYTHAAELAGHGLPPVDLLLDTAVTLAVEARCRMRRMGMIDGRFSLYPDRDWRRPVRSVNHRIDDATLALLAEQYERLSRDCDGRPVDLMAGIYGAGSDTVESWMRRARRQGMLPPARRAHRRIRRKETRS